MGIEVDLISIKRGVKHDKLKQRTHTTANQPTTATTENQYNKQKTSYKQRV